LSFFENVDGFGEFDEDGTMTSGKWRWQTHPLEKKLVFYNKTSNYIIIWR
jgi:hypothetical protein